MDSVSKYFPRQIADSIRFDLIIQKLAFQVLENHEAIEKLCIIGIQERGVLMADRLVKVLRSSLESQSFQYGKLDIAFYRDDYRIRSTPIKASKTNIDFGIDKMKILLVDDVLYTGRTVHAAITALQDLGRPASIELLCMVDRRFNRHFPIQANYVGMAVDALENAYVEVQWKEKDGQDQIILHSGKPSSF